MVVALYIAAAWPQLGYPYSNLHHALDYTTEGHLPQVGEGVLVLGQPYSYPSPRWAEVYAVTEDDGHGVHQVFARDPHADYGKPLGAP